MKKATLSIQLPQSAAANANASAPVDLISAHPAAPIWFQFVGAFVGAYKPEVSVDGGTTWADATKLFTDVAAQTVLAADVSTDATIMTKSNLPLLRFRCTAYTSGAPVVDVIYTDSRSN